MEGYIKVYRQMIDSKYYFSEPFTRSQAWVDLLMLASHKENSIILKGITVSLKRGDLGWSMKALAKRWQWSQGKVDRFLNDLKTERQIVISNIGVTTLISILNYEQYQGSGEAKREPTGSKRGANGEQTGTNNNDNNDNNTTSKEVVYTEQQKIDFGNFEKFLNKDAPDVMKMRETFTMSQFIKLKERFDKNLIAQVCRDMNNKVGLVKKYKSAYSTCLSWCKITIR